MIVIKNKNDIPLGTSFFGITQQEVALVHVVARILEFVTDALVDVATWTVGMDSLALLSSLINESRIKDFRLLLDRSYGSRHPRYVPRLMSVIREEQIRITRSHAKFVVILNDDTGAIISTSMNFDMNRRFESFSVIYDIEQAKAARMFVDRFFAVPFSGWRDTDGATMAYERVQSSRSSDDVDFDLKMKEIDI